VRLVVRLALEDRLLCLRDLLSERSVRVRASSQDAHDSKFEHDEATPPHNATFAIA